MSKQAVVPESVKKFLKALAMYSNLGAHTIQNAKLRELFQKYRSGGGVVSASSSVKNPRKLKANVRQQQLGTGNNWFYI